MEEGRYGREEGFRVVEIGLYCFGVMRIEAGRCVTGEGWRFNVKDRAGFVDLEEVFDVRL